MQANKAKFSRVMAALAEVFGRTLSDEMVAMYWSVFSKYPMDQIEQAARKHLESAKFFPSPAELLEYIPSSATGKHIGADEAWSIVIESFDEESTVVMTSEIAEARGIALTIYQSGDEVGARVAFRDAYNRIIKTADRPSWFVSEGFDKARKADAVAKAVQLGRLPAGSDNQYRLESAKTTVAGLIEDASKRDSAIDPLVAIERIRALLDSVVDDDGISRREKERNTFELHRQQELKRLEDKCGGLH